MRGKRPREAAPIRAEGLIPACAGKTISCRRGSGFRLAHPRVCGENRGMVHTTGNLEGSSPRVRGKLSECAAGGHMIGLIPACAGKTPPGRRRSGRDWAHPRVCGENSAAGSPPACRYGSSPRVRGKLLGSRSLTRSSRLIPACAGKTQATRHLLKTRRAHPRVCGENGLKPFPHGLYPGSSPRVRGKPVVIVPVVKFVGLIPACAGKTRRYPCPSRQ